MCYYWLFLWIWVVFTVYWCRKIAPIFHLFVSIMLSIAADTTTTGNCYYSCPSYSVLSSLGSNHFHLFGKLCKAFKTGYLLFFKIRPPHVTFIANFRFLCWNFLIDVCLHILRPLKAGGRTSCYKCKCKCIPRKGSEQWMVSRRGEDKGIANLFRCNYR